jgi:hypothetical protein
LTNDGGVTSLEANTSSFTSSAHGSAESNVLGLKDVIDGRKLWINEDVLRLTSEGSVVYFHLVALEDADVAWDVFTSLDLDNVSWHNVLGIYLSISAISDDVSNRWDKVLELSHHFSRFGSLHVRENTSGECDGSQHDSKVKVSSLSFFGLVLSSASSVMVFRRMAVSTSQTFTLESCWLPSHSPLVFSLTCRLPNLLK